MTLRILTTRIGPGKLYVTLFVLVFILLVASIRLVRVTTGEGNSTLLIWVWQKGQINFTNSITGHPVVIRFAIPWHFSGFSAQTDPGTEEYYTSGLYRWNDRLAEEKTRLISYCSEVGITITFGGKAIRTQGGCINASLLWPPL